METPENFSLYLLTDEMGPGQYLLAPWTLYWWEGDPIELEQYGVNNIRMAKRGTQIQRTWRPSIYLEADEQQTANSESFTRWKALQKHTGLGCNKTTGGVEAEEELLEAEYGTENAPDTEVIPHR